MFNLTPYPVGPALRAARGVKVTGGAKVTSGVKVTGGVKVTSGARAAGAALVSAALLLVLTACSGGSGSVEVTASRSASAAASAVGPGGANGSVGSTSADSADAVAYPVTVRAANGSITLAARPKAIVSLSPSATETLFAIGAGAQVKAVDDQSDYQAQAPKTKLSGFQPNAEAIAGYLPDLVVISNDANGLVAALTTLKLPVLVLPAPATLDQSYTQELALGTATGHPAAAQRVVDDTKQRIAAAIASVPKSSQGPNAALKVYHELDQTYYSVTSHTFVGSLYSAFGLKNIADAATKSAGGYPQLSGEFVISSAPDLIVLADAKCCQQTPQVVAKRPAFASLPAVKDGRGIAVDDAIASRWGPRVADFAEQIARALGAKI